MIKFKKILFPFIAKYSGLNKFWWQRLFLVIFLVIVITTFFYTWFAFNADQYKGYRSCLGLCFDYSVSSNCGTHCTVYRENIISPTGVSLIAFLASLIVNYLIQIIYYRIFLYIIFGDKLAEFKKVYNN